jgi:transcription termination/antitermination protein NusA
MKLQDLQGAVMQLSLEKGIPKEEVFGIVASAIAAAYKKEYGDKDEKIETIFDEKAKKFLVYAKKLIVTKELLKNPEEAKETSLEGISHLDKISPITLEKGLEQEVIPVKTSEEELSEEEKDQSLIKFKPQRHILLAEAKKLVKDAQAGDWILFPLTPQESFGRIAAQTAKQIVVQRLRELEHSLVFERLKESEEQMISGIVQRIEGNTVYVDLGKATGTLMGPDQISQEHYQPNQRLKVYVTKVERGARGPVIFLSRSSANALTKMFHQEVPEIASGIVEIKAVAREAGSRSKIGVLSNDPEVDPIGSCVGQKGTRIAIIINEFNGEKIDIISWSDDPVTFITNALSPAHVLQIRIDDKDSHKATAIVPEDQQSLAIGKKGQNVRLAAKLTGWKIDVRLPSEQPVKDEEKKEQDKEVSEPTPEGSSEESTSS